MSVPAGESVTVIRLGDLSGSDDEQGNPSRSGPTSLLIEDVAVAPRTTEEAEFGRRILDGYDLYLPSGTVIHPTDLVEVRGETWQVDGQAHAWTSPYDGQSKGVEVAVRRAS